MRKSEQQTGQHWFNLKSDHGRDLLCQNSGIPPTGVGGWFRSNLHASTHRVLEYHQREVGGLFRSGLRNKGAERIQKRFHFHAPSIWTNRLDLNHPPTSVGGIRK